MRFRAILIVLLLPLLCHAETPNSRQARQMFDQVYGMVYGPQGSTLHYSVNIIGLYKTEGTIWYKGKKSKFVDEKYDAYSDGVSYWRAERKKKEVTIYRMDDESRDKFSTKFKFDPENYNYSIKRDDQAYWITLVAKKGVKGMKEISAKLDLNSRHPQALRIKLGPLHVTVNISRFKTGGIQDNIFVFDKRNYPGFRLVDKR